MDWWGRECGSEGTECENGLVEVDSPSESVWQKKNTTHHPKDESEKEKWTDPPKKGEQLDGEWHQREEFALHVGR